LMSVCYKYGLHGARSIGFIRSLLLSVLQYGL
jgi:hypothetical protein